MPGVRSRLTVSTLAVALGLAACAADRADERWQSRVDGSPAGMSETSDCRVQASRLAAARYPGQVQRAPDGTTYQVSNPDRFAAELRLYDSCLRAKGYTRDKT
jgi:hypothetical protein